MVTTLTGGPHIIDNHRLDPFFCGGCLHKVVSEFDGNHLGNMLVLRDGEDLPFRSFVPDDCFFRFDMDQKRTMHFAPAIQVADFGIPDGL